MIFARVALSAVALAPLLHRMTHPSNPIASTMHVYTQCVDDDDCFLSSCSCAMVGMRVCCSVHSIGPIEDWNIEEPFK